MNIRATDLYTAGLIDLKTALAADEAPLPHDHRVGFALFGAALFCGACCFGAYVRTGAIWYAANALVAVVTAGFVLRDAVRARRRYVAALSAHRAALATIDSVLRSAATERPS